MGNFFQRVIDKSRGKTPRDELRARIKADEEKNRVLMMPDEEELKRSRRKKIAGRKGGRASTILTTPGDRLGP